MFSDKFLLIKPISNPTRQFGKRGHNYSLKVTIQDKMFLFYYTGFVQFAWYRLKLDTDKNLSINLKVSKFQSFQVDTPIIYNEKIVSSLTISPRHYNAAYNWSTKHKGLHFFKISQ